MRRELVGYFSADTPSRDIARAIMAAHLQRKAAEAKQRADADNESQGRATSQRPERWPRGQ
jgi:hypothetical protein